MAPILSSRAVGGAVPALGAPALRSLIEGRYECVEEELHIAGTWFSLLRVADTNALLNAIDPATFVEDERLPYWSEIWASSVSLAQWCLASGRLCGKDVLELGCGLGLAGIGAARSGATVVLSDYEEDALLFARYNAWQNLPRTEVEVRHFDWRRPVLPQHFDILLGSDILYERRHFLPLLKAFDVLLAPEGMAVLTDPDRSIGRAFVELAQEWGYSLTQDRSETEYHEKRISITRLELRKVSGEARGRKWRS
jgi:predicted nicotinamide N-methyase